MGRNITANPATTSSSLGAEVAQIYSATGYQAGDLIYNLNGAYGSISDTVVSTATFPVVSARPYVVGGVVGGIAEIVEQNNTGSLNSQNAAKLSNGNIVVCWRQGSYSGRTNGRVYFKITDINNNQVVAPTLVSSMAVSEQYGLATVVALSGGGFAIIYNGTSGQVYRAVYSNTGTVVTAEVTSGATIDMSYARIMATPTTNGGFAAAWFNTSTSVTVQIYNATGTVISTPTISLGTTTANSLGLDITARLNGAVHEVGVAYGYSSGSTGFAVYNAATGATINTNNSAMSVSAFTDVAVCVNTTDNNYVAAFLDNSGTSGTLRYVTINSTYSVSGTVIIDNTTYSANKSGCIYLKSISSGGFYVEFKGNNRPVAYVYNGTYVKQNSTGIVNSALEGEFYKSTAIIEDSGSLLFYRAYRRAFSNIAYSNATYLDGSFLFRFKFNLTSLIFEAPNSSPYASTGNIGNTSSVPVSGYARAASTPATASFYAASTSTQTATVAATSGSSNFIVPQTVADTADVYTYKMTTLSNGNVALVYAASASPFNVSYEIFDQSGNLITFGTVGTTIANNADVASIGALQNGKFVITWYSASATIRYAIYSNAGSLLTSGTVPTSNLSNYSSNVYSNVAGLTGSRFVVAYANNSGGIAWVVCDDTGTQIASTGAGSAISGQSPSVTGHPNGGFYIVAFNASNYQIVPILKTGANNYDTLSSFSLSGNSYRSGQYIGCSMDGRVVAATFNSTSATMNIFSIVLDSQIANNSYSSRADNNAFASIANTGEGDVVVVNGYAAAAVNIYSNLVGSSGNWITTTITYNTSSATSSRRTTTGTSGYGKNVVVGVINSTNNPTISIISNETATYFTTLTAGVTTSNPVTISPYSTGHYLTGVSLTSCAAGASGTVQTNGQAQLNTNYSASTAGQYFDFSSNPAVFGVKGSVSGRTVTMVKDL